MGQMLTESASVFLWGTHMSMGTCHDHQLFSGYIASLEAPESYQKRLSCEVFSGGSGFHCLNTECTTCVEHRRTLLFSLLNTLQKNPKTNKQTLRCICCNKICACLLHIWKPHSSKLKLHPQGTLGCQSRSPTLPAALKSSNQLQEMSCKTL